MSPMRPAGESSAFVASHRAACSMWSVSAGVISNRDSSGISGVTTVTLLLARRCRPREVRTRSVRSGRSLARACRPVPRPILDRWECARDARRRGPRRGQPGSASGRADWRLGRRATDRGRRGTPLRRRRANTTTAVAPIATRREGRTRVLRASTVMLTVRRIDAGSLPTALLRNDTGRSMGQTIGRVRRSSASRNIQYRKDEVPVKQGSQSRNIQQRRAKIPVARIPHDTPFHLSGPGNPGPAANSIPSDQQTEAQSVGDVGRRG
jgi:hypothetical protein